MSGFLHFSTFILSLCALSRAQICATDVQCKQGERCTATSMGYSMCSTSSKIGDGVQPDYPTPPSFYCKSNKDCALSQVCTYPAGGPGICQDARTVGCVSNSDCPAGQTCVVLPNLQTACQITVGGNIVTSSPIQVGGIGVTCQRDSDCGARQRCVDYHGLWQCMAVNNVNECRSTLDCPQGKVCAYSTYISGNICVDPGIPTIGGNVGRFAKFPSDMNQNTILSVNASEDENSTSVISAHITDAYNPSAMTTTTIVTPASGLGSTSKNGEKVKVMKTKYAVVREAQVIPKHAVIDPAALPCEFDYQCRMGESCSGVIALVDRNVTVCQYDVTKENRMCIFHADCLQGQQCLRNKTGVYVCATSLEAALGTIPCTYDYECSGGENCVNIADQGKEKVFRCRQSPVKDPRRDQLCRSNADCPYQQVCRRVAGVSLCVDVVASTDPNAMLSIQRKVVKFVQDLLFARL